VSRDPSDDIDPGRIGLFDADGNTGSDWRIQGSFKWSFSSKNIRDVFD
jgi:hypothetical protein